MDDSTQPEPTKACRKCGQVKPLSAYRRTPDAKDGHRGACVECERAAYREWRKANLEYNSERQRRWRATETGKKKTAVYNATQRGKPGHREAACDRVRQWRQENPERAREAERSWREANPERYAESLRRRRFRRRARMREVEFAEVNFDALWAEQGGMCSLCGEQIDPDLTWPDSMSKSIDHIVPLARGGAHEQSNVQWTHLVCNLRKGAKAS